MGGEQLRAVLRSLVPLRVSCTRRGVQYMYTYEKTRQYSVYKNSSFDELIYFLGTCSARSCARIRARYTTILARIALVLHERQIKISHFSCEFRPSAPRVIPD